jgi:excisionase family DNA binding protein
MSNAEPTSNFSSCRRCGVGLFYGDFCNEHQPLAPLDGPGLYTVSQAARCLNISARKIHLYLHHGGTVLRRGRQIRVRLEDVRPWLEEQADRDRHAARCWAAVERMMDADEQDCVPSSQVART